MSGKEQNTKMSAMAADLKARGIFHGKRTTTTHAPPVPSFKDVGSAAYRRRIAKLTAAQDDQDYRRSRRG